MTENSDSEVESMGEKVFNLVRQIDPTHTADITGELARFSLVGKTFDVFTVLHETVLDVTPPACDSSDVAPVEVAEHNIS